MSLDNSRKSSKSVEPSTKQARMKIQRILDEQKAHKNFSLINLVNTMETKLFHKSEQSPNKQRSKSVLKPSSPYKNVKQLPEISNRLNNFSSLGGDLTFSEYQTDQQSLYNMDLNDSRKSSKLDEIQLQSTLDRYKSEITQDSVISNFQQIDFKQQLQDLQIDKSQNLVNNSDPKIMLSLVDIMKKHQIFKKINKSSVKSIIQNTCSLMLLKKGQVLYKEEDEQKQLYIVIFGCLNIWNKKNGHLGRVIPGFSAGEECFIDSNFICRLDNCYAEQESCVFTIDRDTWLSYRQDCENAKVQTLIKDLQQLDGIFNRNQIIKKGWKNGGISKILMGTSKNSKLSNNTSFFNLQNNNNSSKLE
eukprot:403371092